MHTTAGNSKQIEVGVVQSVLRLASVWQT